MMFNDIYGGQAIMPSFAVRSGLMPRVGPFEARGGVAEASALPPQLCGWQAGGPPLSGVARIKWNV